MNLDDLERQRDAYASKIGKLALYIAVIFAVPAVIAIAIGRYADISLAYLLPIAFVISWILVAQLYRRIDKKVRELESRIRELKREEHNG
jgi:hypothetical protein